MSGVRVESSNRLYSTKTLGSKDPGFLRLKGEQMKDIKINIATKSNHHQVDKTQKSPDYNMTKEQVQALIQGKIERAQKHIKAMEHIKSIN